MQEEQSVTTDQKKLKILFFDTETSGFISKKLSSSDPDQAWVVQIGAILSTKEKEIDRMNVLIQANGREINYHAEKIHGISVDQADKEGIPELDAAERFGKLIHQADLIVCHNFDFDWIFVQQMMERNLDDLSDEARSAYYMPVAHFCTMKDPKVKKFVQAKNKNSQIKWPKLIEVHEKLFDKGFDGAHDAFADITATKDCFFELIEQGIITNY